MPTNAVWLKIDGERVAHALEEALEKLNGAEGEMVLDFSSVRRIDPGGLRVLETLARTAGTGTARIVLCAVNVDVYKVLKLTRLTPHFSFLS